MIYLIRVIFFLFSFLIVIPYSYANGWDSFKQNFITTDGRVIDTANENVSHSEGQGYGMLLAVSHDDRKTFDLLWAWTHKNLSNDLGLFYWKYVPNLNDPLSDKNNASDGDVLIAWALQRASQKWHVDEYQSASNRIQRAIIKSNVVTFADHTVMLPGSYGFNKNTYIILNPSYFIFEAWSEFAEVSHLKIWRDLISDGLVLLDDMRFGDKGLPLDWVALNADGSLAQTLGFKNRFSYDAIRIPLNVWWFDPKSVLLTPYKKLWSNYSRDTTPAWFDVLANTQASYNLEGGLLNIRDLTLGQDGYLSEDITPQQNYYSASLQLKVWMAYQEKKHASH